MKVMRVKTKEQIKIKMRWKVKSYEFTMNYVNMIFGGNRSSFER